jgi:hypothetical protein
MAMQSTQPIAGTHEDVRTLPLAMLCVTVALAAFGASFTGATGGRCGELGCSGFPEWLYVASGWLVLLCLAGLLLTFAYAAIRRLRR